MGRFVLFSLVLLKSASTGGCSLSFFPRLARGVLSISATRRELLLCCLRGGSLFRQSKMRLSGFSFATPGREEISSVREGLFKSPPLCRHCVAEVQKGWFRHIFSDSGSLQKIDFVVKTYILGMGRDSRNANIHTKARKKSVLHNMSPLT